MGKIKDLMIELRENGELEKIESGPLQDLHEEWKTDLIAAFARGFFLAFLGWSIVFTICLGSLEIRRELRGEIISFESDPFAPMTDLECETIAAMRGE
jgi:hypothetical protein